MTDYPMNFNAAMVQALLDGRKTQTRRVLKDQPNDRMIGGACLYDDKDWVWLDGRDGSIRCRLEHWPGYTIGGRLWCREDYGSDGKGGPLRYPATDDMQGCDRILPAIVMPLSASRLTLIVTDVWVQRLQQIGEADAIAEGFQAYGPGLCTEDPDDYVGSWSARTAFSRAWDTVHGKRPEYQWRANPWVCALTFDVVKANIDEVETGVTVRQIEGRAV